MWSSELQDLEFPIWDNDSESMETEKFILRFRTELCPDLMLGRCQKGKMPSVPQRCFHAHLDSQRRRPVVDPVTGRLRYWDFMCPSVSQGGRCSLGDSCPFAHNAHELSYHASKYKTKLCKPRECRGKDICCFAHGPGELRTHAPDRYSIWRLCRATLEIPTLPSPVTDAVFQKQVSGGLAGVSAEDPASSFRSKRRFCCSFPNVAGCRRGDLCTFAHSRDEIEARVFTEDEEGLKPSALTVDFFINKFKTVWCPIGAQHDWQTCVYAHNYQDARRDPAVGYGPAPCAYWKCSDANLAYEARCPLGYRCPFAHGAKEQLYHPSCFQTALCQEWQASSCPRGSLCAFVHKCSATRMRIATECTTNYRVPLSQNLVEKLLQPDFKIPPFQGCETHSFEANQNFQSSSADSPLSNGASVSTTTSEPDELLSSASSFSMSLPAADFRDTACCYFFNDYTCEWQNGYAALPAAVLSSWSMDAESTGPIISSGYEIDGDSSLWLCPATSQHSCGLPLSSWSTAPTMFLAPPYDEEGSDERSMMLGEVETSTDSISGRVPPEMFDLQAEFPTRNGFIHFTQEEVHGGEMKAHGMRPRASSI